MSEGKRPGGLTALAVINFILGAFGVIGAASWFVALYVHDLPIEDPEAAKALEEIRQWDLAVPFGVLYAIVAVLLIVSGVGYLRQKRVLGKFLGTLYAILALGMTGLGLDFHGFDYQTLVGLAYPVITLLLLHLVFRDDLVN